MDNQRIINGVDADELLNHLLESLDKILSYAHISKGIRMRSLADIQQKETLWIDKKIYEATGTFCPYCDGANPLVIGDTDDVGIAIKHETNKNGRSLIAYGYDVHGSGTNGLVAKINYCPICGKHLKSN